MFAPQPCVPDAHRFVVAYGGQEATVGGEGESLEMLRPALVQGDFAVGIPSRDFFVAISLGSSETVESVRKKVEDDFQNMDHPLSDRLLLVTYDGVTEYAPWV